MKFKFDLHIILYQPWYIFFYFSGLISAQEYVCQGSIHTYGVDTSENGGLGTVGSTYEWRVVETGFQGNIQNLNATGNQISIYWGDTPSGSYTLELIESDNSPCFSTQTLDIVVENIPEFQIPNAFICPYDEFITLEAPPNLEQYTWTNDQGQVIGNNAMIAISSPGNYTVEVQNHDCVSQQTVEVLAIDFPTIRFEIPNNSTIIVQTTGGNGTFEYQLQDDQQNILVDWQSSNVFTNVPDGNYWVFLKSTHGNCITKEQISLLAITNIITPNNDGVNDVWDLSHLLNSGVVSVQVFDRYGKQVAELLPSTGMIWNGKYNQMNLPSETYWYRIHFDNGSIINGYVSIKDYQ